MSYESNASAAQIKNCEFAMFVDRCYRFLIVISKSPFLDIRGFLRCVLPIIDQLPCFYRRLGDHFLGKQHIGFQYMRDTLEAIKKRREDKRSAGTTAGASKSSSAVVGSGASSTRRSYSRDRQHRRGDSRDRQQRRRDDSRDRRERRDRDRDSRDRNRYVSLH